MVRIAGILNITPDSFYDGGRWVRPERAVARGVAMRDAGATWIDVGGESTRPGAGPVPAQAQLDRVLPVVEGLVAEGCRVSIDTTLPEVAAAALDAGAEVVNDINGLRAPGMIEAVAAAGAGVVVMHMRGTPASMQRDTAYDDVVTEVRGFLAERVAAARAAGIQRIWADPGIGFGKSVDGNLALMRRLGELRTLGVPLYVGASRKSFIGKLDGDALAEDRLGGSIAAAVLAARAGADVLRVHDVAATRQALTIAAAIAGERAA
ncbi:MAG: dihydropteroate synthase [Alphaproteobacteria bacterium]|nr:dihydropteroate synthase [Alphaproteobacteria bacterium]